MSSNVNRGAVIWAYLYAKYAPKDKKLGHNMRKVQALDDPPRERTTHESIEHALRHLRLRPRSDDRTRREDQDDLRSKRLLRRRRCQGGVGRVRYLSGDKAKGETLFNGVLAEPKLGKNDLYRIATSYAVAKDWSKAKPLFERAIAMDLEDDSGIMKAACWFNLNGDRARAEELFKVALTKNAAHAWH